MVSPGYSMGLFDKVLKDVTKGLQDAVDKAADEIKDKAVDEAKDKVADEVKEAVADSAVDDSLNEAASEASKAAGDLKSAISGLNDAISEANEATKDVSPEQWEQATSYLEGMAKDMMKGMRVCFECDEPVKGDQKFCPKCGAELPSKTVMELAVCSKCGKQNSPGEDFCGECGAKLPLKEEKEARLRRKDEKVLDRWPEMLQQYPVWGCGGTEYELLELEPGRFLFSAWFEDGHQAAVQSVREYREALKGSGYRTAGQYPSEEHLYKMVDGVCCHADTEHCFEGDDDSPSIYFAVGDEPMGGFDYVKPEPKKKSGDLFGKFFK